MILCLFYAIRLPARQSIDVECENETLALKNKSFTTIKNTPIHFSNYLRARISCDLFFSLFSGYEATIQSPLWSTGLTLLSVWKKYKKLKTTWKTGHLGVTKVGNCLLSSIIWTTFMVAKATSTKYATQIWKRSLGLPSASLKPWEIRKHSSNCRNLKTPASRVSEYGRHFFESAAIFLSLGLLSTSRKRRNSKTLFKLKEFENSGFAC